MPVITQLATVNLQMHTAIAGVRLKVNSLGFLQAGLLTLHVLSTVKQEFVQPDQVSLA